jgi:hypothetical protein
LPVFIEYIQVVLDWLVQQIYLHSNITLVALSVIALLVAGLTLIQCLRAWKNFLSKRNLLKELHEHLPPSQGS